METSVRVEPGVLAICCVAEKDNPSRLRFFEIYADEAAYTSHRETAHFKKYAQTIVLLEQPYIRDDSKTIRQLVEDLAAKTRENIVIRRFTRFQVGS